VGLGDHHHAILGDGEAASPITFQVDADLHFGRDGHPLVDDGPAYHGVSADLYPFKKDGIFDPGEAVNPGPRTQDRPNHRAARHYRAQANDAVQGLAAASIGAVLGKYELGRRQVGMEGPDWPPLVVQVQLWIDRDQVHVGFVVGVERANVTPVGVVLAVLVTEGERVHPVRVDHRGNDVPPEVVGAAAPRSVDAQLLEQEPGVEDVNAHRRQAVLVVAGDRLGVGRLFFKTDDPALV